MSKVLSTKLTVDEVDRFSAAAEQQGLSKAEKKTWMNMT